MNKFVAEKAAQAAEVALDYLLENQGGFFCDSASGLKVIGKIKYTEDKSTINRRKSNTEKNKVKTLELICMHESLEFMQNIINSRKSISKINNYFGFYKFNDLQIEFSKESYKDRYHDDVYSNISDLQGLTLNSIYMNSDNSKIYFRTKCLKLFVMEHIQDCCEHVTVEDIVGDINDIIDTPILLAEETSNESDQDESDGTIQYTYYKLSTIKGDVSIRWYGSSNGHYSTSVDFIQTKDILDRFNIGLVQNEI